MKPRRPSSMTAAKRAALEADSIASSPPTSLTALFGGAYRLLDSVAMAAPCVGGVHMITRWGEAAATDLRSCARLHTPRTRRLAVSGRDHQIHGSGDSPGLRSYSAPPSRRRPVFSYVTSMIHPIVRTDERSMLPVAERRNPPQISRW